MNNQFIKNTNLTRSFGTTNNNAWYKTDVPMSSTITHGFLYFALHENVQMLDDPQDYEVGEPIKLQFKIYVSKHIDTE